MTENNKQIDIKEKVEIDQRPSASKRALMKGAAAVPVVLTLRSGAAFAKVSTGSCIIRDNKNAGNIKPPTFINNNSQDTWVRRSGFRTELKTYIIPTSKPVSSGISSRVSTVNPSSSESSSSSASPSRPAIPSRPDSAGPSTLADGTKTARPSGDTPFVVYTLENPSVNPGTLWQHELNTPEGALLGTTSPNETFIIVDKKLMESADRRGEGKFFTYGNITGCEILVHIGPNSVLGNPSNFTVGAVNVLEDGVSLPHVTGSCWASVGPAAASPSRV